jgi:nicotinate-nucleotide--dimethylbenzimidazole phosphoribosyltransferase
MGEQVTEALGQVIAGRRDIRRYRPDPVEPELLERVLEAGHSAPSVGHSQPWRFVVVRSPETRERAAHLADTARLRQARDLLPERAARLLDLKLEGLREAPIGIVVACDRRTPANGVLGRATFTETDVWSCACAIQNMWLTARSLGLGMGWVTLFEPSDLAALIEVPEGVETLGWMCLGWPDERPPEPGLQRASWSTKLPLEEVVLEERWPEGDRAPAQPLSHLRAPGGDALVDAGDGADTLLAPPESLGVLDWALNRVVATSGPQTSGGRLVLAGADHPVVDLGISAYEAHVTADVLAHALTEPSSLGAAHARAAGLAVDVVDAGVKEPVTGAVDARPRGERGNLRDADALTDDDLELCVTVGQNVGRRAAADGLVVIGEVGVGNTTVAAALTCALLGVDADDVVGLGSGADAAMSKRKLEIVSAALERSGTFGSDAGAARRALRCLGGPEIAVLTGVCLAAADAGTTIVLDGLATSVAALVACRLEPAVQGYLVAGQRSREKGHALVLTELGLEPLLDLRLRAGEGVGGVLAAGMLLRGLEARRTSIRTTD